MEADYRRLEEIRTGQRSQYDGATTFFFMQDEELDQGASRKAGRPIYKPPFEMFSIRYPGGDETCVPVSEEHKRVYAEKYAAFKARQEQPEEGTPLKLWPPVPKGVALELAYFGFKTVEQLAGANDEARRKIGVHARYCKMAKDWLDAANSKESQVTAIRQQMEALEAKNVKQAETIELLMQKIEALSGTRLTATADAQILNDAPRRRRRSIAEASEVEPS